MGSRASRRARKRRIAAARLHQQQVKMAPNKPVEVTMFYDEPEVVREINEATDALIARVGTPQEPMTPREVSMEDPSPDDLDAASGMFERFLNEANTSADVPSALREVVPTQDEEPAIPSAEHSMQEDYEAGRREKMRETGRGYCPVCQTSQKVRKDLSVGKHPDSNNRSSTCAGTGQPGQ